MQKNSNQFSVASSQLERNGSGDVVWKLFEPVRLRSKTDAVAPTEIECLVDLKYNSLSPSRPEPRKRRWTREEPAVPNLFSCEVSIPHDL